MLSKQRGASAVQSGAVQAVHKRGIDTGFPDGKLLPDRKAGTSRSWHESIKDTPGLLHSVLQCSSFGYSIRDAHTKVCMYFNERELKCTVVERDMDDFAMFVVAGVLSVKAFDTTAANSK